MIHAVREREPAFPPDTGQTRTLIAGWWVEWSGTQPTEAEVLASEMVAPDIAANVRAEVKAMLTSDTPVARAIRALLRMTKPNGVTLQEWRKQFADLADANA